MVTTPRGGSQVRSLTPSRFTSFRERLGRPVDGASLAFARIGFGAVILYEVVHYFRAGLIARYWIDPIFHFTYYGFGWVRPLVPVGMYILFAVMGVAAILVIVGARYRVAAAILWLCFTYQFLIEQARYLNHFYAASLFAFLLAVVPANAEWSIDRTWRKSLDGTIPTWALWLLRTQVGLVYLFGGIAKLNGDWLRGAPVTDWMTDRAPDLGVVAWLVEHHLEVVVFAYGGLALDLLVVPALLWRRTRPFAFLAIIVFHVANANLFTIGIFPPMMVMATTLFFEPDWPRRLLAVIRRRPVSAPLLGLSRPPSRPLLWLIGVYLAIQLALPFRHLLYPGDVAWTEEGHRFSWRMMLRHKSADARFVVVTPAGRKSVIAGDYLKDWQIDEMESRPDMILQFAHYLAARERARGVTDVRVYASVTATLNRWPTQALIDSTVDLAAEPRTLGHARWVVPLNTEGGRSSR